MTPAAALRVARLEVSALQWSVDGWYWLAWDPSSDARRESDRRPYHAARVERGIEVYARAAHVLGLASQQIARIEGCATVAGARALYRILARGAR